MKSIIRLNFILAVGAVLLIITGCKADRSNTADYLYNEYSISYDSNGADSGDLPADKDNIRKGNTVTVLDNSGNLSKTGYIFACWTTSEDGSGTSYMPGESFTIESNIILYAQWGTSNGLVFTKKDDNTYSVNSDSSASGIIVVPETYNDLPVSEIEYSAFTVTDLITCIILPESINNLYSSAFLLCSGLKNINVKSNNIKYTSRDGVLFSKDYQRLICYPAGKTGSSFNIPSTVNEVVPCAFVSSTMLKEITVDSSNTTFKSIDGVLYNKDENTLICYPAGKTGTTYTIPDYVTTIDITAFGGCGNLEEIVIPEGVTTINTHAFAFSSNLKTFNIPASVVNIGERISNICISLQEINVADSNTILKSIDGVLFNKDCTTLITYPMSRKGSYTVPDGVKTIEQSAFEGCLFLTDVSIPESCNLINNSAFMSCYTLEKIIMSGSTPPSLGNYVFDGIPSTSRIKVPKDSLTVYKTAAVWYGYSSIITTPVIYAAGGYINGSGVYVPCYWADGVMTSLAVLNSTKNSYANTIKVIGSNFYIGGSSVNSSNIEKAGYWKNGTWNLLTPISSTKNSRVNSISVFGSDVYSAGYCYNSSDISIPGYWENDTWHANTYLTRNKNSSVNSIVLSGPGPFVYTGGYCINSSGLYAAGHWKSGTWNSYEPMSLDKSALATSIVLYGKDIYAAGISVNSSNVQVACYWKNGVFNYLPSIDETQNSYAASIAVSVGDVYVAGYGKNSSGLLIAGYWKNSQWYPLTPYDSTKDSTANLITFLGKDIYIAGYCINSSDVKIAGYWKNGEWTPLSLPSAIAVDAKGYFLTSLDY